jgi:hypothetical protein
MNLYGGRRRRTAKKKAMKGGAMYGFGIDQGIGSAGAARPPVENVGLRGDGTPVPGGDYGMLGGRRRRTGKGKKATRASRKGGRKSRRTTRRRGMRGGGGGVTAGVGASFTGRGVGGMGFYEPYTPKAVPGGMVIGGDGVPQIS